MVERKTFVVLGLGIFGSTIAENLYMYGHDVIAIDKDMDCVRRIENKVTKPIAADFTDFEVLENLDIAECDAAIVATGSHLEESVLAIMNLKRLKIPYIIAKAKNKKYMQILAKLGADRVIRPEKEMGERIARKLVSNSIVDLMDIDSEFSMVELNIPDKWVGKTLMELDLRNTHGINIIGIRKENDKHLNPNPDPNEVIEKKSTILIIADKELFKKIDDIVK